MSYVHTSSAEQSSSRAVANIPNTTGLSRPAVSAYQNTAGADFSGSHAAPIQLVKKPGAVYTGKTKITPGELRAYLKSGEITPLKDKMRRISQDPWVRMTYRALISSADTVGKLLQTLFDLTEAGKDLTLTDLDVLFTTNEKAISDIEDLVIDEEARAKDYNSASFKGSGTDLAELIRLFSAEKCEGKSAEAVLQALIDFMPLTFRGVKADIIATYDNKFFVKADKDGDRSTGAAAILQLVKQYQLKSVTAAKKISIQAGAEHVVIVEGLPLESVEDSEMDGWEEGISPATLAEIGFVILHTGVGDVNSLNARKLKGSGTYAIIDTGGSFASGRERARAAQIETNYKEFLQSLDDNARYLKTWEQLVKKVPDAPAELLA